MERNYNEAKCGIFKEYSYRAKAEKLVDDGQITQKAMDQLNEYAVSILAFPEIQEHIKSGGITIEAAGKLSSPEFASLMKGELHHKK